ncbi:MAG: hypothetical protein AAF705_08535 [Bacteroidota bacterium]
MKRDPIEQLIKESKLSPSKDFTQLTMDMLDVQVRRRLRIKLVLLAISVALLFCLTIVILIVLDFRVDAFGLIITLPKILTMTVVSMSSYFAILHLFTLVKWQQFKKLQAF